MQQLLQVRQRQPRQVLKRQQTLLMLHRPMPRLLIRTPPIVAYNPLQQVMPPVLLRLPSQQVLRPIVMLPLPQVLRFLLQVLKQLVQRRQLLPRQLQRCWPPAMLQLQRRRRSMQQKLLRNTPSEQRLNMQKLLPNQLLMRKRQRKMHQLPQMQQPRLQLVGQMMLLSVRLLNLQAQQHQMQQVMRRKLQVLR